MGSVTVSLLSVRPFHWGEVRLLGSERSAGRSVPVRGRRQPVLAIDDNAFDGIDIAIFASPADAAEKWIPHAIRAGAKVVDGSGWSVRDPAIPVVVPSLNGDTAFDEAHDLVSVPGGMTSTLSEALAGIHGQWGLEGVIVSTYEPASAFGFAGVDRLREEIHVAGEYQPTEVWAGQRPGAVRAGLADVLGDSSGSPFVAPLALNVIPLVGDPAEAGWSTDEQSLRRELRRVLGIERLPVVATRVLVPVITGHCASIHVSTARQVRLDRAKRFFIEAPDIVVLDDPAAGDVPTPADVAGADPLFVGRIRQDSNNASSLDFFVAGDNIRRATSTGLLKVAELIASMQD